MAYRDDWFPAEKLHRAAEEGDMARASELVREGAALNVFDDIGYTPLHYAAKNERFEIVQLLIEAGANINAREEETNSDTAIAVAAESASPGMVKLLLQHGADPSITGWMGLNAYDRAAKRTDEMSEQVKSILGRHTRQRGNAA